VALPTRPHRLPLPTDALSALAGFLRDRLAEAGRWGRGTGSGADQVAGTDRISGVAAAATPFAPTSYARARLLRQLHACGLLDAGEAKQAEDLFGEQLFGVAR
jgi:hypothetical protein